MNTTNTSRQILVIFLVFIFIASGYAVAAADFTPVGPQNMRGLFPIFNLPSLNFSSANSQICFGSICGNVTNFTSGTQYQADGVSTFLSGNSFSVNGTWVNNTIDSRVSSKLDVSDQRYNDTSLVNSVSSNLQTNITLVNDKIDGVNASVQYLDAVKLEADNALQTGTYDGTRINDQTGSTFNGNNQYINSAEISSFNLSTSNFSYAVWFISYENQETSSGIFSAFLAENNPALNLGYPSASNVRCDGTFTNSSGTDIGTGMASYLVSHNIEHQVICIYQFESNTLNSLMYVDGVLRGNTTKTNIVGFSTLANYIRLGAQKVGAPRFFNGSISQATLWNRALSASEVSAEYALGPNTPTTNNEGLVLQYLLNRTENVFSNTSTVYNVIGATSNEYNLNERVSGLNSTLTAQIAQVNESKLNSTNPTFAGNLTSANFRAYASGEVVATQGNFSQGIFINADNSNFSNPKNITFTNTSTNESTAFLLDQNSGLIGHQGFQVELFGYGSLVLNGKTANVSIPGNRSNLNYATSVLAPSNNKALQVFGETNTTHLTIASATAVSCDLKAYTNGTVYCGTDSTGGSGSVTGTGLAGSIAVWVNSTHLGDNSNESVIMNFTNNSNTIDVDSAYSGFNFLKPLSASSFTGSLIGSGAGITGLSNRHTHEAGNITPGHFTTGTYVLPGNLTVNGSLNEGLRIMRQTLDDFVLIRAPGGTVTAVSISASDGTTSSDTMNIFTISGVVGADGKFSATRGDILFQQDVFFDTGLQADGDVRVNGTFYVGTGTTAATSAVRADVTGNLVATTANFTNINLNGRAFKPSPAYYRNNTWYSGRNGVSDSASLTQTFSSNSNRAGAWVAKGTAKFDQLSVSITTASAGSVCIFGVYNASYNYSNGVWYPDKLLANTSQVNGSATGTFNYSVTPVQVIEGEVYFDVYNCNTGTTIRYAMLNVGAMEPILGEDTNTGTGNMFTLWADADTHDGTLPSTFQPENMVANSAMIALYKRMRTDI